jgi:subtilase family serine protease
VFRFFSRKASTRSPQRRQRPFVLEQLEPRNLLSATTATLQPQMVVLPYAAGGKAPFDPSQIATAYGFTGITFTSGGMTFKGNGAGQTIAIVDADADPNIASDLATFDRRYGIPDPSVAGSGSGKLIVSTPFGTPQTDPFGGWPIEQSLDVEWAHAMAPAANILLVQVRNPNALFNGVTYAANYQGTATIKPTSVVSMSWGFPEFFVPTGFYDSQYFSQPLHHIHVSFIAASGDFGSYPTNFFGPSYPATSPKVLSVGGTTLTLNSDNTYNSESGWYNGTSSGGGGGLSASESIPI